MLGVIVFSPLIGFFSGIFFGRFLGRYVTTITVSTVLLSWAFSLLLFVEILSTNCVYKMDIYTWFAVDILHLKWSFLVDGLTCIMLLVVTSISFAVHLFSTDYMSHDPHISRFMSYLSLFTFFMLILVTSSNFLQMFVGWEGVGFCSYLLINFWFTRIQANKSAIKAMLVNRVGDFFILISFFSLYTVYNSLEYDIVFNLVAVSFETQFILPIFNVSVIDFICLLLLLGAMGKSAQIGLHSWLPDAMEGPTPVSALIHAATMVTAGVFLIIRCSYLFEYSKFTLNLVIIIGSLTAFFAATTGLFQNDIKRIIAYSTCSQLGYMVFSCGLSNYETGIFHLSNHAFFKALLFLSAGSIIHAMSDEQDIRNMGGLLKLLPLSYCTTLIGSLALTGFPFLSGFYSKDIILESSFSSYTVLSTFAFYLGILAAFCTCFYSFHLIIMTFFVKPNSPKSLISVATESRWQIQFSLVLLLLLSVTVGYSSKEVFTGFGTNYWSSSIFVIPANHSVLNIEFIPINFKLLPLLAALLGAFIALLIYIKFINLFFGVKSMKTFKILFSFLSKKWYFDRVYNQFINQEYIRLGYHFMYKDVDRGLLETAGPSGLVTFLSLISLRVKFYQSGYIFHYLFLYFMTLLTVLFSLNIYTTELRVTLMFFILIYVSISLR